MEKFKLDERLADFSVAIINLVATLPKDPVCDHLGSNQLLHAGMTSALNYGEAQAAESRADFIKKIKMVLKELRESFICLKILNRQDYLSEEKFKPVLQENNELISIFVKTLKTAHANLEKEKVTN